MEKIIGIFGGDSQTGTSMIAQSLGEAMSERGEEVLLINASCKYGDDFFKNKGEIGLDMVKANLINNTFDELDLDQIIIHENNLSIIPGIRKIFSAGNLSEQCLNLLISVAKRRFKIIIIDGGDNVNMGMVVSALKVTTENYFVITQQPKSLRRFQNIRECVLVPLNIKGKVIVNKFIGNIALFSEHEMSKVLGIEESFKVPYIDQGWQAEIQRKTLMSFPKYKKAIENISQSILGIEKDRKWKMNFVWKSF